MNTTSTATFLEFCNAKENRDMQFVPLLHVNIGGGDKWPKMTVDTGSTGIVVAEKFVGPQCTRIDPQPDIPPPHYSSSGVHEVGYWAMATVRIGQDGRSVVTANPIRIFVVTAPASNATMMGVGILGPDQSYNPFMTLRQIADGHFRRGYIVSAGGVSFGYDEAEISTFTTFPFTPSAPPDATVTLTPPAGTGMAPYSNNARFLFDTGIGYMIVTPRGTNWPNPGYQTAFQVANGCACGIIPGAMVDVSIEGHPVWSFDTRSCPVYSRTSSDPPVPEYVRFARASENGILNSGHHLLQLYDYLIDLDASVLGLRKTGNGS